MIKLALLGKDIQHSKSPEMYRKIYDREIDYRFLDHAKSELIPSLEDIFSEVEGLSITAPYKEHFLDQVEMSSDIIPLKAINCIKSNNGKFFGTNTDYTAMVEILDELSFKSKEIILLGSGAMARITKIYLDSVKKEYTQISRNTHGDISQIDIAEYKTTNSSTLIINCCARVYEFKGKLPKNSTFWDYNYSHGHNEAYVSAIGNYVDGLDLLYRQAIHATKFWNLNL
jgi:shikimate dehydrogenase